MTELHERARKMTVDEWYDLDEDDEGELVAGVLVEEEMPGAIHELVVSWLIAELRAWLAPRGGFVFGSELKFALGKHHGRKPDVSLYLPGANKPPRQGVVRVPPDLAIEVLSPRPRDARRDRIDKSRAYARFGVKRYWLVDPAPRTVECHELNASGRYERAVEAAEGKITVPGLAGLELDLDALWAEIDRLAEE